MTKTDKILVIIATTIVLGVGTWFAVDYFKKKSTANKDDSILKLGSKGNDVRELQILLNNSMDMLWFFDKGSFEALTINGIFDKDTESVLFAALGIKQGKLIHIKEALISKNLIKMY